MYVQIHIATYIYIYVYIYIYIHTYVSLGEQHTRRVVAVLYLSRAAQVHPIRVVGVGICEPGF